MRKSTVILFSLLFCVILCQGAYAFWVWTPKSQKFVNPKYSAKDTPEEQFKWAMGFFEAKEYERAAEEFAGLTTHFKDSLLAPEAQYYAGRSYEALVKPYPAFLAYQKMIDVYPFAKRIDEIMEREYNLGRVLFRKYSGKLMGTELMTDLDRASEIFRKVRENAPFGKYADKAQFMIGQCSKKAGLYSEAIDAFQKVIDEYPESELIDKAKYEIAQSAYLASSRPDYDQELTDEAIENFKTITETTSDRAISEQAEVAILSLQDKKAESLFKSAKFYESQKRYRSACVYYKEIVKKYPRSSFSELAAEELKALDKYVEKEDAPKASALKEEHKKGKKWIFF